MMSARASDPLPATPAAASDARNRFRFSEARLDLFDSCRFMRQHLPVKCAVKRPVARVSEAPTSEIRWQWILSLGRSQTAMIFRAESLIFQPAEVLFVATAV
jgi:hypothetical protein